MLNFEEDDVVKKEDQELEDWGYVKDLFPTKVLAFMETKDDNGNMVVKVLVHCCAMTHAKNDAN